MPFWSVISVELHSKTLYIWHAVSLSFPFRWLHKNFAITITLQILVNVVWFDAFSTWNWVVKQVYYPLYVYRLMYVTIHVRKIVQMIYKRLKNNENVGSFIETIH